MLALSNSSLPLALRTIAANLALDHTNALVTMHVAKEYDRVHATTESWDAYVNASHAVDVAMQALWEACENLANCGK